MNVKIVIDWRMMALALLLALPMVAWAQSNTGERVLKGFEVVIVATENDSTDYKTITVSCPPDKIAIGGGAGLFFSSGGDYERVPVLISSFMYPDNRTWYAEAVQPPGVDSAWYIEAQVFCAFN